MDIYNENNLAHNVDNPLDHGAVAGRVWDIADDLAQESLTGGIEGPDYWIRRRELVEELWVYGTSS